MLRLLGGLCALAGFLAWGVLLWKTIAGREEISPEGDAGDRLLGWGLGGTLLMIGGMVLLHLAADAAETDEGEARG